MTLFIVDIDGCIAHGGRRFAEAGPEPSRDNKAVYDAWVAKVQNEESLLADLPVPGMRKLVITLAYNVTNARVYFLTSRETKWCGVTEKWLKRHGFLYTPLLMRETGDYTEGCDFKERVIKQKVKEVGAKEVVVMDDDEHGTIEAMCKKNGYTFLKARSGGQI